MWRDDIVLGSIVMRHSENIGFGVKSAFQAGLQAVYFTGISAIYDISGRHIGFPEYDGLTNIDPFHSPHIIGKSHETISVYSKRFINGDQKIVRGG